MALEVNKANFIYCIFFILILFFGLLSIVYAVLMITCSVVILKLD